MQKNKTIQFWDGYHDENDSEEWISKPGNELLGMISDQLFSASNSKLEPKKSRCEKSIISILEIGCGTSTLVRDLKRYIEERHPTVNVIACGTDVSKVCVGINTKRDCLYACTALASSDANDIVNSCEDIDANRDSRGSLWYEVLNVLEGVPSRQNWDVIIDKGCLDTFLFRSRQRGTQNKSYPESLRILLDNLHRWQAASTPAGKVNKDHNDVDNDKEYGHRKSQQHGGTSSVYIFITPRSKLKAIRDYAGFSSVRRYELPGVKTSDEFSGKLEGKKNNDRRKEQERLKENFSENAHSPGYMFVCTKNEEYNVGVSTPFPTVAKRNKDINDQVNDENQCPRCKQTFRGFRKEEDVKFRGAAYWTRKWKAHRIHCKSDPLCVN